MKIDTKNKKTTSTQSALKELRSLEIEKCERTNTNIINIQT